MKVKAFSLMSARETKGIYYLFIAFWLTCLAELSYMRPGIIADTLETAPELFALCSIATRWGHTRWFAVFDNLREMHWHIAIYIQYFTIYHQTTETANQSRLHRQLLQQITVKWDADYNVYYDNMV